MADGIECKLSQDGEVMGGVIGSQAHLVIVERHIHAPVQAILDAPMLAHSRIDPGGIRWQAGNVAALLGCGLVIDGALGNDDREGFQVGPAFGRMQAIYLIEGEAAPGFDAAVILLDNLIETMRGFMGGATKAVMKSCIDSASSG